MVNDLTSFKPQKDFLICVDSDGCAMDTMDIKHIRCFGPCMVKEWTLEKWSDEILARWNAINLYTMTRGINRFKALAMALTEIHDKYCTIEDIADLVQWAETSDELSNAALERTIGLQLKSVSLRKALAWSVDVNKCINKLPDECKVPFDLAKEALAFAHERADVAIVSSANLDAVLEEWERFGLLEHTDIVLAQNAGSKAFCIGELLKKGYACSNVVMCGDAPGDLQAAEKNGVFYYPILVKHEKESWQEFISEGFERLVSQQYAGEYAALKRKQFLFNLGGGK
ncbi:MAG: HAD family hydrolase [Clostridia bacterium]|nr:HAD family hydrolase [Clostridia bacterium]